MHPTMVRMAAKERFSYPLRPRLARSAGRDLACGSRAVNSLPFRACAGARRGISLELQWIPGSMLRIAPE
jgi:hypothetical protein